MRPWYLDLLGLSSPTPDIYGAFCLTLILFIMAIINSLAIGKSVKSAGNLTYKTVRGRTIASQRITTNKSNTYKQANQRASFGASSQAMVMVQKWINSCYEKSKYGSARNAFLQENKKYSLGGLTGEVREGLVSLYEGFVLGVGTDADGAHLDGTAKFAAYGSSSVIAQEDTFADSVTLNEEIVYFTGTSSSNFIFPQPVTRENAEIVLCGFFLSGSVVKERATLQTRVFSLTESDIASMKSLGLIATVTETDGFVESVGLKKDGDAAEGIAGSLFVAFPRVGGKIPTMRGWFLITTTQSPIP